MRIVILAVAVGIALPATGATGAQEASPGSAAGEPGSSPARRRPPGAATGLARALLSEEQWDRILDDYAASVSEQVSKALTARSEPVPNALEETIRKELEQELQYEEVVDAQARALARQLTPDELSRAAAFYSSPLGKKILARLPEVQAEVGQQLQTRLSTALPEIVQRIAPKALAPPEEDGESGSPESRSPPPQAREPPPTRERPRR